ncbi:Protein transport protein yos1 [Elsinoe fawcettii]|nr:Protein transport protein yos1 [Elsinoe fawcettii]
MAVFFGLGGLIYISVLLVNAIAILSEDRFLARIGWSSASQDPGFGGVQDTTSVKAKIVNLIASVRTLMRSTLSCA